MYGEFGNIYISLLFNNNDPTNTNNSISNYVSAICFFSQSSKVNYQILIRLYKLLYNNLKNVPVISITPEHFYAMKNLNFNNKHRDYQELSEMLLSL